MIKTRIKVGDLVEVTSGKDRGKQGKVIRVLRDDAKVIVEGVNMMKRHKKPSFNNQTGQIVEFSAPIHISNVMLFDGTSKKRTRIGMQLAGDKRVRIAKQTGNEI